MENYEALESIGTGSFGNVTKIKRKSDGKILVWKQLDYGQMNDKEKQLLVSEVNILRELRHPNIVRYYDRIIDRGNTKIYIVMEWCEGGDLASVIKRYKKNRQLLDEDMIWRIFVQIVMALDDCHRRKNGAILHRDIKPGNIFLDANQNVKLGDFGLARVMDSESPYAHTYVGTPFYMSPEQTRGKAYNEKSDIWSLGCLLYEMATLSPPFEASTQLRLAEKIQQCTIKDISSNYSSELSRLIKAMIQVDQNKRPTCENILTLQHLANRVREKKLKDHYVTLKRKEEELKAREEALIAKEKLLDEREQLIRTKEAELIQLNSNNNYNNNNNNKPSNNIANDRKSSLHFMISDQTTARTATTTTTTTTTSPTLLSTTYIENNSNHSVENNPSPIFPSLAAIANYSNLNSNNNNTNLGVGNTNLKLPNQNNYNSNNNNNRDNIQLPFDFNVAGSNENLNMYIANIRTSKPTQQQIQRL